MKFHWLVSVEYEWNLSRAVSNWVPGFGAGFLALDFPLNFLLGFLIGQEGWDWSQYLKWLED